MFAKRFVPTLILALSIILIIPLKTNALRKDKNFKEKPTMKLSLSTLENEYIKFEDNSPNYAYNIQLKNSDKWMHTTAVQRTIVSGYKIAVLIDDVIYDVTGLQNGVEKEIIPDVTITLNATFVNQGQHIKIEYVVNNYSSTNYEISVATYANILIDNKKPTQISPFLEGFGLKMTQESVKGLEFNFIGAKNIDVKDVDTFWCGDKLSVLNNLFSNARCGGCLGDNAISFSWKNRELHSNSQERYSVLMGVGKINNAPKILITNLSSTNNAFYIGKTYEIKGLVLDSNGLEGTEVYYCIDNGDKVLAHTFDAKKHTFTSSLKIPSNLSEGIHRIDFFAKDNYGMLSNTQIVFIVARKQTCTISFETNGGSSVQDLENVQIGTKLTPPKSPLKQGFDFVGWYKDESLNCKWDFENDEVKEDIKLYAKWQKQTATVSQITNKLSNPELVSIVALSGTFDESVEMKINYDPKMLNLFDEYLNYKDLFVLDIDVFSVATGQKVQPNKGKSVQITLPVPKELINQKDKLKVALLIDNKIEFLDSEIIFIDDVCCIRFFANHFSPYAFYIEKDVIIGEGETPKSQNPTNNLNDKNEMSYNQKTPKTSDDTKVLPLFICMFSTGICFVIIKIKNTVI